MIEKISLAEKFARFAEHWQPKIVAELNGQYVKLVAIQGDFPFHHHETEDELFLVVRGRMQMRFRDGDVWLEQGELIVIPHGVEHAPFAEMATEIVLFEPRSTLNTGTEQNERTAPDAWI